MPATAQPPMPPTACTTDPFHRDLGRLLLTFIAVVTVDLILGSLLGGQIRVWFPQWLDPMWAENPDAVVVYSQSYLAGVFLLPVLAWIVDRDLLAPLGGPWRVIFWVGCLLVLLLIVLWKGELMINHDKQAEAIAFGLLTVGIYAGIVIAQRLERWLAGMTRRELLRRLLAVLAIFFLVMAVVDPVLQLGVQGMDWSRGLIVEIVFFVPMGLLLLWITRRMRPANSSQPTGDSACRH